MGRGAAAGGRPTVLSSFSGGGGLDVGLEAAGFRTVGCLEIDEDARRTIARNRPGWPLLQPGDVVAAGKVLGPEHVDLREGELDLLAGGPPCQPFSKAAQWSSTSRQGFADDRGRTVLGMLSLLEKFLPRALLIENVAGFLRGPTSVAGAIEERLGKINRRCGTEYVLRHHVVDAAHYGVPQRRKRVIAVACRDGADLGVPEASHASAPMTAWDVLHDLEDPSPPSPVGNYADLLPSIPEGGNYLWLTDRGGGDPLFGYRTRFWSFLLKLAKDQPSWTLAASPGPSTGPFHWENRPLSVRERLRLQSYPDDWEFVGTTRAQVRLVGNATPPLLAEVIGRHLQVTLLGNRVPTRPMLLRERGPAPRPPVPPRSVPERHRQRVGTHAAHAGTGRGPAPRTPGPVLALPKA